MKKFLVLSFTLGLLTSMSAMARVATSKYTVLSSPSINGAYCVKSGQTSNYLTGYDAQASCLKNGGKLVSGSLNDYFGDQ